MTRTKRSELNGHEITEWHDCDGNSIGATVYLSPDEVKQLQEAERIEIVLDEGD